MYINLHVDYLQRFFVYSPSLRLKNIVLPKGLVLRLVMREGLKVLPPSMTQRDTIIWGKHSDTVS